MMLASYLGGFLLWRMVAVVKQKVHLDAAELCVWYQIACNLF